MTLLELLLVLAILAMMGSMVVPLFSNGFAKVTLSRAGDELLAAWSKARTQAIETGEIQQFRFQAETPKYRVEPLIQSEEDEQTRKKEEEEQAEEEGSDDDEGLDSSILFHTGRAIQAAQAADATTDRVTIEQLNVGEKEWSEPVLFFPDGTTSTAAVTLKNDREQYVQATLRGLTGVGRTSEVLTKSEWQAAESK